MERAVHVAGMDEKSSPVAQLRHTVIWQWYLNSGLEFVRDHVRDSVVISHALNSGAEKRVGSIDRVIDRPARRIIII